MIFNKNKYFAKRSKCNLGHSHPSMLEGQYCNQLQMLERAKAIHSFDYAKKYELRVNGKLVGSHKPDFTVITKEGKVEVHETKGMATSDWLLRKAIFEAIYPEIAYIVVRG